MGRRECRTGQMLPRWSKRKWGQQCELLPFDWRQDLGVGDIDILVGKMRRCFMFYKGHLWKGRHHCRPKYYFSLRTPLKGVGLDVFWSMKRPVSVSRLTQFPLGAWVCERPLTAPIRRLSPFGGLVAISGFLIVCGKHWRNNSNRWLDRSVSWLRLLP